MEEWKQYRLIDALDSLIDYRGKTPRKTLKGIPLITAKIIKNGRIKNPTEFISEDDYDSWMVRGFPHKGDVVLTTEAPLGEVAQLNDERVALAQRVVTLRGKAGLLNNTYLKYFLISRIGQQRLKSRETGTTVTGIKQSELREVLVDIPPYDFQVKIASILSALDDKIENNRRINENLEKQAQALFKSWFVDFEPFRGQPFVDSELGPIPQGWKVVELGDFCTIKYGKGLSKNDLSDKGYPVFGGNGVIGYYSSYLYELPQILVSCRGAASGKIIESLPKSFVTSNSLILELLDRDYYYYLKNNLFLSPLYEYATGSAQPQITIDNIKGVKILIPNKKAIMDINSTFNTIDELKYNNDVVSRNLAKLRDTLLPKLMSGEIKV